MLPTEDFHFYEPAQGHNLAHDPLSAIVGPRPIGWVSSRDPAGVLNLAPYSFFNAFNYRPPIIGFSSIGRKDSLNNIERSGEFAWNLATRPLAEAVNTTSIDAPADIDEFQLAGLTPAPSRTISVPRVAECPVSFECRVTQIVQLQSAAGAAIQSWLVLGEVTGVHIARSLIKDGVYDTAAAHPILRGGGLTTYFEISDELCFHMTRPRYTS
jgi:flavin reductase (DIM6/NTAB) family NADH-FMN oxidoreductase RutF